MTTDVREHAGRLERHLPAAMAVIAVLGAGFGALVLHRPGLAVPLTTGLLAQVAATWVLVRTRMRPYAGMTAVATVAAFLAVADSPWRELLAVEAVPWVPLALAWATVRAVENSRSPRQSQLSVLVALVYVVIAGVYGPGGGPAAAMSAAVPVLGGLCAVLAKRLSRARRDRVAAPEAVRRLRDRHRSEPEPAPDPRIDALSPREREVLALLGEGLSNAEIGARLYLSERSGAGRRSPPVTSRSAAWSARGSRSRRAATGPASYLTSSTSLGHGSGGLGRLKYLVCFVRP